MGIGEELLYAIRVANLGQQATGLIVTDTVPLNTTYVPGSATGGGMLVGGQVVWEVSLLGVGRQRTLAFAVTVDSGLEVRNDQYGVICEEGVGDRGAPVVTRIAGRAIYLPAIFCAP
ncbi:MAG: DUF11 domain-containing protein [Anaerolineae bacterium]|nr:DUF11 domain-containing protein [Anaerolineae bacterium]